MNSAGVGAWDAQEAQEVASNFQWWAENMVDVAEVPVRDP